LRNKVIMASKAKLSLQKQASYPVAEYDKPGKVKGTRATRLVIIGASTGGPKALHQVIPRLPADIPAAILVVQHMPPGFTNSLAKRLDQLSRVAVKEADFGDELYNGTVYIARGGYHMVLDRAGNLTLNQNPTVCGVRPSVDVTMESAVSVFGNSILGVVLTGMGSDGTHGSQSIKNLGGKVIVEDESTCVVWGMPKSVALSGYADLVLPLPLIPDGIVDCLKEKVKA
jgi:two-component system, chemotaxis family, protein-glutamate methylesterase/glutaminase